MKKTDTLYFRQNLSQDSIESMRMLRKMFIHLSSAVEALGESRELSAAFTHLEQALSYSIKHICLADPQATKEDL